MAQSAKVVHYLNQFFGGFGGEEHAYVPVQKKEGPVGPGRALQAALGDRATVVATIVAGDNYYTEEADSAKAATERILEEIQPDVVVAGPAFDAGRYGLACAEICRLAQARGIPAVTGMHPDNAGVLTYRREIVAVPTGSESTEMVEALQRMSRLALKLLAGEELGPASQDGYIPRGFRRQVIHEKRGCERAVDMLIARLSGRPWVSEMLITSYDRVPPAQPVKDLKQARVAMVTTGGLVPRGNRDRLVGAKAEQFFRYEIEGTQALAPEEWESVHDGFNTAILNRTNPNYAMPLSYARHLEKNGELGGIYPISFCTTGNATAVTVARRMGSEIAEELRQNHVDGALLVAT